MNVIYSAYRKYRETIKRTQNQKRCKQYLQKPAVKSRFDVKVQRMWLLITVAFNSPDLIEQQYLSLKNREQIMYLVVDNSSKETARATIEDYCQMHEIGYISLPPNPELNGSDSHALALNWAVKNVVVDLLSGGKIQYWGILDHDIYNLSDNNKWFMKTADILRRNKVYGLKQVREEGWYLWPGFTFFEKEWTMQNRNKIDFGVTAWGDTGSKMRKLYTHMQGRNSIFATQIKGNFDVEQVTGPQENEYEIFDNEWLHTIGGSGWAGNDAIEKNQKLLKLFGEKIYG